MSGTVERVALGQKAQDDAGCATALAVFGAAAALALGDTLAAFGLEATVEQCAAPEAAGAPLYECRFALAASDEPIALCIPATLIGILVDLAFGGDGKPQRATDAALSPTGLRLTKRLGETLASHLRASVTELRFIEVVAAETDAEAGERFDFVASGPGIAAATLRIMAPHSLFTTLAQPAQPAQTRPAVREDPAWRARLRGAVAQASLPVRTIFARPELPVARALALKPGDLIPIVLPRFVPVTVGGHPFAEGSVGESNGRVAVKIEKIVEGSRL